MTLNGAKHMDRNTTKIHNQKSGAYQGIEDELYLIDELLHRLLERRVEAAGPFDVMGYLNRDKS